MALNEVLFTKELMVQSDSSTDVLQDFDEFWILLFFLHNIEDLFRLYIIQSIQNQIIFNVQEFIFKTLFEIMLFQYNLLFA